MHFTRTQVLIFGIIVLAVFLRTYHFWDRPHSLYSDEVAIGWNAYSILKTGKDEYNKPFPFVFRSFNDYKLPLYIYLTSASMAIFGKTEFAVRIVSVTFGIFAIYIFMALVKLLTGSAKRALLCGLLLTISPWHLQFSRAGFEANVSLTFMLIGVYLILRQLIRDKPTFFWGIFSIILAMHTYHSPRLLGPLKIFAVALLYPKKFLQSLKNRFALLFIPLLILTIIPYLLFLTSSDAWIRTQSESLLKDIPHDLKDNIEESTQWATLQFTKNYLSHFSLDFLFFSGDQQGRHSVREMGMLYLWQMPLVILGLILLIRNNNNTNRLFLAWALVAPAAAAVATPSPHALRALPLIIPLTYASCVGLLHIYRHFPRYVRFIFMGVIAYSLSWYLHVYYDHYPKRSAPDWSDGLSQACTYASQHQESYAQILFSNKLSRAYAFCYFYGNFDPAKTQKMIHEENGYAKFDFTANPDTKVSEHALIVSTPEERWPGNIIRIIKNKGGDPAVLIWEN